MFIHVSSFLVMVVLAFSISIAAKADTITPTFYEAGISTWPIADFGLGSQVGDQTIDYTSAGATSFSDEHVSEATGIYTTASASASISSSYTGGSFDASGAAGDAGSGVVSPPLTHGGGTSRYWATLAFNLDAPAAFVFTFTIHLQTHDFFADTRADIGLYGPDDPPNNVFAAASLDNSGPGHDIQDISATITGVLPAGVGYQAEFENDLVSPGDGYKPGSSVLSSSVHLTLTPVPEPTTLTLSVSALLGLAGAFYLRRRGAKA